jgi:peptidoglycan/LPS O-acetylase OafA/YrhL
MSSASSQPSRLLCLDLLRVLAVLLVLGHHAFRVWLPPSDWPEYMRAGFVHWARGGWVGVDLFFVLSGFLVSGLLFSEYLRHGRISPGRFYVRRGFKIYPAFYVMLVTAVLLITWRGIEWHPQELFAEAVFMQNYLRNLWVVGHTWSLAVEEHFYLALPLLLLVLARPGTNGVPFPRLPLVVGCTCLAVLGLRIWQAFQTPFAFKTTMSPTHLRLDSLLFGVLLSYYWHFYPTRFKELLHPWRYTLIGCGAVLFLPAFLFPVETTPFLYTAGLTLLYLGGGALLVGVLLSAVPVNAATRFLGLLGAYSYSVYLWHLPVIRWGVPGLERLLGIKLPSLLMAGLAIVGSFCLGVVMAKLIENPALALRDRLFPARSKPASQAKSSGEESPQLIAVEQALRGYSTASSA